MNLSHTTFQQFRSPERGGIGTFCFREGMWTVSTQLETLIHDFPVSSATPDSITFSTHFSAPSFCEGIYGNVANPLGN